MSTISIERAAWIRLDFIDGLRKFGFDLIGEGAFSEVYGKPYEPYVYKVSVMDRLDDGWLKYAKLVMSEFQDNPHAPKIYKLKVFENFYIAKMERLEFTVARSYDEKVQSLFDQVAEALHRNPSGYRAWDFSQQNPALGDLIFAIRMMGESCDFHDENAMIREDGTFVITDPIY